MNEPRLFLIQEEQMDSHETTGNFFSQRSAIRRGFNGFRRPHCVRIDLGPRALRTHTLGTDILKELNAEELQIAQFGRETFTLLFSPRGLQSSQANAKYPAVYCGLIIRLYTTAYDCIRLY